VTSFYFLKSKKKSRNVILLSEISETTLMASFATVRTLTCCMYTAVPQVLTLGTTKQQPSIISKSTFIFICSGISVLAYHLEQCLEHPKIQPKII
jgi:hypothetical protein